MPIADPKTLDALNFASVRERVVGLTGTARGRALAGELTPLADFGIVRREQSATAAVFEMIAGADFHVGRAIETSPLTESAALGRTLGPADLRAIAEALASAAAAYKATRTRPSDAIAHVTGSYAQLSDLVRALSDAIDERGNVMDRASAALGRIRRGLLQAQADARDRTGRIARSGDRAIQDAVVTIRDGRFVVPIKVEFSAEFGGIVHDSSSSGQTLFVEPLAALEANNRVRTLRLEEEREVGRILAALSRFVGQNATQIERNVEMLAQLDVLTAKATLASAMGASTPALSDAPEIVVVRGRHPLLGERAVPQSLVLDDVTRLLVISGPNMGGKTVALKMVGLFVAMTYAGLQIPAAQGTRIGSFAQVFADIGDEQSIVENTSTFSAHLHRMGEILSAAGDRTLVLVDEIGGGTEPSAGAALAVAFLERLLELRACGIVTTHATELKLYAHAVQGVANASVRFDPQTFAPTYALDIGSPGQSLAFPLARALGIDPQILDRAQTLLDSQERDYEAALAELAQRNAELQVEREAVVRARARAADRENDLRDQRDGLERQRRDFTQQAETRMAQALRDFVAELARRADENAAARAKVTASQAALLHRTIEAMRADLGLAGEPSDAPESAEQFEVGDRVQVLSLHQDGDVAEDFGDTALIAIGALKMVAKKNDLRRISGSRGDRQGGQPATSQAQLRAAARTMAELDVRGKRFVEAEPIVERWIDEATLAGNSPLRLIHGKGTGLLGRGLQEYLRDHPSVVSVRYGNADEGDGGVTIVELK